MLNNGNSLKFALKTITLWNWRYTWDSKSKFYMFSVASFKAEICGTTTRQYSRPV